MGTQATAIATITNWDEAAYDEAEGTAKTTKARVTATYSGDLTGETVWETLMAYAGEEAEYVGLERVSGTLAGRSGTFAVTSVGAYRDGAARATWQIVPGTATGELTGLRGEGTTEAGAGSTSTVTFSYDFD